MWLFGHHRFSGGGALAPLAVHHADATGHALSAAQINATILAIAIAALSGYLFMVWQTQQAMETEAVEHANATQRAPSRYWFVLAPSSFNAHDLGLGELRDALERIVLGIPSDQLWQGKAPTSKLPPATNTQARAEALLVVLSAMWRVPPLLYDPERELTDVAGVETWLSEVEWPMRRIVGTLRQDPEAIERLVAAVETGSVLTKRGSEDDRVEMFTEWAERFLQGVQETKASLDKLRRYERRRLPSRPKAVAVAVLLPAVFLCGVVVPLAHPSVTQVVYAYIPAGFYAVAMLYAVWTFGKEYRR